MGMVATAVAASATEGGKQRNVITSYAPATGEAIGEAPVLSAEEVRAAVRRARAAQESWALLPIEERAERILRWRDLFVERAEELIDLLSRECGKPRSEALIEITVAADFMTYFAKHAKDILAPREIELHLAKYRRSYVHYAPRGVIGSIAAWNFPLIYTVSDGVQALMAGNACVTKPSEATPLVPMRVKEIYDAAGLPEDLLQVITGYGATGAALIESGVDMVVFTGAVSTGRKVAEECARQLVPCTLELGGKAPFIVCADADLERAARAIVWGGFCNVGQVCISVERVYAHEAVYDRLCDRVTELTQSLRVGDPAGEVDVGAIIFPRQIEVAEKHIADALAKGAELRAGGRRPDGPGQFFQPTVLTGCTHDMTVMREEIFGPIVPIMRVRDDEEAVRLANESHLGLMGYVFTKDREKGRRLAERVRAGTVMVNDVILAYAMPETPFGGVRDSGMGRIHGEEGLRSMCEVRHVNVDRVALLAREPIWYPYSDASYKVLLKATRVLFGGGSIMQRVLDLF